MNVLVLTHFYPPEPCAGATRVASLVASMDRAGHAVTVVTTFPSFPHGRFSQRPSLIRIERAGRVRTVRLLSLLMPCLPGSRLLHWLSSAISASLYAITASERYDVVIVSSPPITLAMPALVAAWRNRSRLVVDVRDVYPDIAVAMGVWKPDGLLTQAVERVARFLYRRADLIVAVTPTAISQIAERGIDSARLVLARNAAERSPVVPMETSCKNGFKAIYAGNLGVTTDIDVLVDAAALVARHDITIEIVGDGAQKGRLDERVRNEGIRNVVIKGSVPRPAAMAMVAGADVSIIPLRRGIEESIPTKLYDSLSVGCPVLVVADGEAKREGASLGAVCTPSGDAEALAAALRQLALLGRAALRRMGDFGRACVEKRADRDRIMEELAARIGALH